MLMQMFQENLWNPGVLGQQVGPEDTLTPLSNRAHLDADVMIMNRYGGQYMCATTFVNCVQCVNYGGSHIRNPGSYGI